MIKSALAGLETDLDFVELIEDVGLKIDLRYASSNNFMSRDVYGPFRRAFLHRIAAIKLSDAYRELRQRHPGYGLVIFDALRPRSIQRVLWDHVKGSDAQNYIANPDKGSMHNFGFAVDLTVMNEKGVELDMGAGFDDFRPISQPRLEAEHIAAGQLSEVHMKNRMILRGAMEAAGFSQLPSEWWHFEALPRDQVRAEHRIVE
ncbi:MAG: M15 family metallopeptidase [Bdellovibrionales bacterium]